MIYKDIRLEDCNEWDGDKFITLSELYELIPKLQNKYGKHAVIKFDAGYNNVGVMIGATKKVKNK